MFVRFGLRTVVDHEFQQQVFADPASQPRSTGSLAYGGRGDEAATRVQPGSAPVGARRVARGDPRNVGEAHKRASGDSYITLLDDAAR
jgi:hypothetical protein